MLFSTHVVEDLAATCTQLAIMKKGSFLYSGSVSGLLENERVVFGIVRYKMQKKPVC